MTRTPGDLCVGSRKDVGAVETPLAEGGLFNFEISLRTYVEYFEIFGI